MIYHEEKLLIMFFSIYSHASLIGSNFSQRDLQILEELNIKSSFITDYKLQEVYEEYQKTRNSNHYVTKLNEASLFVPRVKDILREEGIPEVLFIWLWLNQILQLMQNQMQKLRDFGSLCQELVYDMV